jgi:hypothetical protein
MMDDKPAQRKAANDGPAPTGKDIRAKLKKREESKHDESQEQPVEPAKKTKGK